MDDFIPNLRYSVVHPWSHYRDFACRFLLLHTQTHDGPLDAMH